MPTRKTLYWLFCAVAFYAIAFNVGSGWLYILAALITGAPLASLALSRFNTTGVTLSQETVASARQGDSIETGLSVLNRSHLPRFFLRLDGRYGGGQASMLLPWLKGNGALMTRPLFNDLARGVYPGAEFTISSSAPFGLIRSRRLRQAGGPLVVYPGWHRLSNDWDTGHRNAGYVVSSSIPSRRGASDYLGVREYRPQDSPRSIHWRTTARSGRLSVIDYAHQTSMTPVILIDTWAGGKVSPSLAGIFETSVYIAASLVQRELVHNRRFGLGSSPADAAARGLGHEHDPAMLLLARVQADATRPMDLSRESLPWPTVTPVLILTSHRHFSALPDSEFLNSFPHTIVIMLDVKKLDPEMGASQGFMDEGAIEAVQSRVESGGGGFLRIRSVKEVTECLERL